MAQVTFGITMNKELKKNLTGLSGMKASLSQLLTSPERGVLPFMLFICCTADSRKRRIMLFN